MKTSTVKTVEARGTYSNGHQQFNKFQVSFENGDILNFLAKGDFKKGVGELCEYEITNEQYNSAKVVYPKPNEMQQAPQAAASNYVQPKSKDQLIIRQSMTKAAVDFHSQRGGSGIDDVIADAQLLINFINE
jgi:hypothetical protein